jgi:hypothetical protein
MWSPSRSVSLGLLALGLVAAPARAADVDPRVNSKQNPFACLGGSDALTGGGRTMAEVNDELRALLGRIDLEKGASDGDEAESAAERAVDLCVAARLKARLGQGDASDYFARAIAAAPREPGFELFAGIYWATMRGARRPLLERAEQHLYAGLAKLQKLRDRGDALAFHDTVEDWIHKRLLVLYQQDGLQILPWKAYRQGTGGLLAPGLSFSSQLRVAQDTRDFFYNSEMRQFTGEANFGASDLRAATSFDDRDTWDIARAPRRFEATNRLRLRHNLFGALDVLHKYATAPKSQIRNFYDPNSEFVDVTVVQYGLAYQKTVSLYPLFDVRLAGGYQKGRRQGTLEFEPLEVDQFTQIDARPSFARFIGTDVLTVDLTYVRLDFSGRPGGVVDDRLRRRDIRGGRVEYGLYSPLILPSSSNGELGWERTATRGLYFFAGAVDDRELWGRHTVVNQDFYGGARFAGVERWSFMLQGTGRFTNTEKVNPNVDPPQIFSEPDQKQRSGRASFITQVRLVDEEAIPGVPPAHLGLGVDMMNLVFPVHYDHAFEGRKDYENVRAGVELWTKVFGLGVGGAAVLVTVGYDFQYFHRIGKGMHLGQAALRLGWDEL